MRLPELLHKQATQLLDKFCRERVPCKRYQGLKLNFSIIDTHVTLFEEYLDPLSSEQWLRNPIARFTYVTDPNQWVLYSIDRQQRWHIYQSIKPSLNLTRLIRALDEDPTGAFWA